MSREREIEQGLRDPSGALIGGLVVEDYNQGMEDFESQAPPPSFTSASYDLGRERARQKTEANANLKDWLERDQQRRDKAMREILADHPTALAEYEAKIAAIRCAHND